MFDLVGSVGLVSLNDEIGLVKELINKVDVVCYLVKEFGCNWVYVFDFVDMVLVS